MNMPISKMHILILGATSGTGRRLAVRLIEQGAFIRCLLHSPEKRDVLPADPNAQIMIGSADDPVELGRLLDGIDTVVHLAGQRFTPGIVAALSQDKTPRRLVVQSSTRLFSRYATPTREAVRISEQAVESAPEHIAWTILRASMIFGGQEDRNLEKLADFRRRHYLFPIFGRGYNKKQPVCVADLVAAHLACLATPETAGKSYTIAGPEAVTYRQMADAVTKVAGLDPPKYLPVPRVPCLLVARLLRLIWKGSPISPEMIERFGENDEFDITPARQDFGYSPIPLEDALMRKFKREI